MVGCGTAPGGLDEVTDTIDLGSSDSAEAALPDEDEFLGSNDNPIGQDEPGGGYPPSWQIQLHAEAITFESLENGSLITGSVGAATFFGFADGLVEAMENAGLCVRSGDNISQIFGWFPIVPNVGTAVGSFVAELPRAKELPAYLHLHGTLSEDCIAHPDYHTPVLVLGTTAAE